MAFYGPPQPGMTWLDYQVGMARQQPVAAATTDPRLFLSANWKWIAAGLGLVSLALLLRR